eukprot:TRINITY_DN27957_c0_g1_i2.p1 TRINITY_DN27957_c0_g1~~TRINITY_DN27957_c0_g1_i2.p1  ORF type:complete len:458 (-),score=101.58 TRINITY_DN27957_c0_g1_i2:49-1422(-)
MAGGVKHGVTQRVVVSTVAASAAAIAVAAYVYLQLLKRRSKAGQATTDRGVTVQSSSKEDDKTRQPLRVVEFFAGMGGMRAAGLESGLEMEVVAAYEISDICARAYLHNYPDANWRLTTIEYLQAEELDAVRGDVWLMSPPCQPFTRSGKRLDHEDNRTHALLRLIELLSRLRHPPRHILLENVIGFERSESRRRLLVALAKMGWECSEFALDPQDFGLPNRRPRYYGLFRAAAAAPRAEASGQFWRSCEQALADEAGGVVLHGPPADAASGRPAPLGDFMSNPEEIAREEAEMGSSLEVPERILAERTCKGGRLDVHLRSDRTSACLTKVYGKLPRGFSALVVVDEEEAGPLEQRPKLSSQGEGPGAETDHIWRPGARLRYLSPKEQLRLMGYPATYSFPGKMTFKERSGLIGNSLNVRIVAWLLPYLVGEGAFSASSAGRGSDLAAKGWGVRVRY